MNIVEEGHLPDIMNFPNGSIDSNQIKKFNNILYYDENLNFINSINKDSDYFEKNTLGAFILCTNLESLKIIREEILKQIKKELKIEFNLITTGSKCEKVLGFIKENKEFDDCIKNVCIYCMNLDKYQVLKTKYPKIHEDIYNKRSDVVNFINKFSNENIKPFPITKLITYEEYIEKYKERHLKIAEFYGDLDVETYHKSFENIKNLINEESANKELKKKNQNELLNSFLTFDINKDLETLDKLIIKEYTKNTFYGDLNKWLMKSKMNFYEPIAYFTARLMYSLNSYASENNMFYNQNKKTLYRGIKIPYSCLLPYERAKGKIILLTSFTSTSESKKKTLTFSGRKDSKELYKVNLLFSVLFIIKNIWKKDWVSNGINIQNESEYKKEKEILFQPFSFYYVEDVKINISKYTADIYLETIGKTEVLEEQIKEGKLLCYNKKKNIIEIAN